MSTEKPTNNIEFTTADCTVGEREYIEEELAHCQGTLELKTRAYNALLIINEALQKEVTALETREEVANMALDTIAHGGLNSQLFASKILRKLKDI